MRSRFLINNSRSTSWAATRRRTHCRGTKAGPRWTSRGCRASTACSSSSKQTRGTAKRLRSPSPTRQVAQLYPPLSLSLSTPVYIGYTRALRGNNGFGLVLGYFGLTTALCRGRFAPPPVLQRHVCERRPAPQERAHHAARRRQNPRLQAAVKTKGLPYDWGLHMYLMYPIYPNPSPL